MSTVVVLKIGQPGGATKGVVRARSAVTVAATDGVLDDMVECGVCECTGRRGQRAWVAFACIPRCIRRQVSQAGAERTTA